jgi:hypothetical protein
MSSLVLHRSVTMDQYDPDAFDFPRRVNDGMVHVLLLLLSPLPSSTGVILTN